MRQKETNPILYVHLTHNQNHVINLSKKNYLQSSYIPVMCPITRFEEILHVVQHNGYWDGNCNFRKLNGLTLLLIFPRSILVNNCYYVFLPFPPIRNAAFCMVDHRIKRF